MAVNFQHLRAFQAIALERSVTKAARRLNVAQPTLSQQLKALEQRHGVNLFESRKAPLKLSAAGLELLALTSRMFAAATDVDEMLGEVSSLSGGTLRLGSDSPPYAARVVTRFHRQHPDTLVQVRMGNAREVMHELGEARFDATIASDPPVDGRFTYDPLYADRLCVAMPEGHVFASLKTVPVLALENEVLLIREPTSKTRNFTERALAAAHVEPRNALELQSRETIREGVALGLGVSVFFSSECPPDRRIEYRPLDTGKDDFQMLGYLVCLGERRHSAIVRALRKIAADIGGSIRRPESDETS